MSLPRSGHCLEFDSRGWQRRVSNMRNQVGKHYTVKDSSGKAITVRVSQHFRGEVCLFSHGFDVSRAEFNKAGRYIG